HRIDRRSTGMRVVGRKLLVHPIKIKNAADLPDQMIRRHHLVEVKRVEKLALSAFPPPHHRLLPANHVLIHGITALAPSQREFCNRFGGKADENGTHFLSFRPISRFFRRRLGSNSTSASSNPL